MSGFDFKLKTSTIIGRFTSDRIREIIKEQFSDLYLSSEAKNFLAQKLGNGQIINGSVFNEKVDEAKSKGYITSEEAEKIKDKVRLPDNLNKHWN